ncbi:MAG: hypothetical protein WCG66_13080 [bacterium]
MSANKLQKPQFHREEEPYRALGLYGPYEILFQDATTKLHNGIQMYHNISRIHCYSQPTDDVIFDRAPVDWGCKVSSVISLFTI